MVKVPKSVVVFFPSFNVAQISKCVIQIPYHIAMKEGLECIAVSFNNKFEMTEYESTIEIFAPKLKLIILEYNPIFKQGLQFLMFLNFNAVNIKLLYLYLFNFDFSLRDSIVALFYKFLNKEGKLFVRFEADMLHIKNLSIPAFGVLRRTIFRSFLSTCDYFGVLDSMGYPHFHALPEIKHYLKKKALFYQPSGFNSTLVTKMVGSIVPFDQRENTIVLSGRLDSPEKGLRLFLKAIKDIDLSNWQIILFGGDISSIKEIIRDESTSKFQISQIQVKGHTSYSELYNTLNKAKIYVLPSYLDGMPLAAVEAMALGAVIISANHFGMSVLLDNGRVGRLFTVGDYQGLGTLLEGLLKNQDQIRYLHEISLKRAWQNYSWESIINRVTI